MFDEANLLEQINSQVKKIKLPHPDNEVLFLYGETGSGKSSLINYLMKNTMKF